MGGRVGSGFCAIYWGGSGGYWGNGGAWGSMDLVIGFNNIAMGFVEIGGVGWGCL